MNISRKTIELAKYGVRYWQMNDFRHEGYLLLKGLSQENAHKRKRWIECENAIAELEAYHSEHYPKEEKLQI